MWLELARRLTKFGPQLDSGIEFRVGRAGIGAIGNFGAPKKNIGKQREFQFSTLLLPQIGALKLRAAEVRALKLRGEEVRALKLRASEVRALKLRD